MQNADITLEVLVRTDIAPRHGENALHSFELNLRDGSDDTKVKEGDAVVIADGFKARKRDDKTDSHREGRVHIDFSDGFKSKKRDRKETKGTNDGEDIVVADGF